MTYLDFRLDKLKNYDVESQHTFEGILFDSQI